MFDYCSKITVFFVLISKRGKWTVIEMIFAVEFAEKAVSFPSPNLDFRSLLTTTPSPQEFLQDKAIDSKGNGHFARTLGSSDACRIPKILGPEKGLRPLCHRGKWTAGQVVR